MLLIFTEKIALLFISSFKSISTYPSISLNSPFTFVANRTGTSKVISEMFLSIIHFSLAL